MARPFAVTVQNAVKHLALEYGRETQKLLDSR